ncbi:DNA-binding MarR family transcriptional regulator [Actinoplanes lutulentus]|uniref:DNA-binding MarR family transcriptional regulator n=1 Tax=Actinoplanes lutulentus TaxID=1287878 RepID=A0A327ZA68_9ACTN|nr:MarR family winged helix-turn-helix transcriptional regulator [Actinoplanes lutulentus]MBB2943373.1 DNA-binding MarR family transcriptional regulator [Actinoplanes lutulentus]RAK28431.1 DNA-binding MarR family transcriptional regulator [Actinoplanes lutulentus]
MSHNPGISAALVRLSFLVQRRYARVCAGHDLSPAQAQLMCVIKDQARGMTELTHMLGLERPGLTGLVDRIERRGLLRRESSQQDRRAVTVALTPRGKEVTEAFFAEVTASLQDAVAHLPETDRQQFEAIAFGIIAAESVPAIFGDAELPGGVPETL